MVFITAEAYKNAGVAVIKNNENYFWVKIVDAQRGLGLKCMRSLIRREVCGIYETGNLIKEQKIKYIRSEFEIIKNFGDKKSKYARNDIMEKVMKNCRGVKKSNDGTKRLDKEKQRKNLDNFWVLKKMKYLKVKNIQLLNK